MGKFSDEALITSKFWVEIGGVAEGFFRECTGLQIQTEVFEYNEGGRNNYTYKFPVRSKANNVVLKRGLVVPDGLWRWYRDVIDGKVKRSSVTIHVYDNHVMARSSGPATSWRLQDAFPVRWTGPDFNSNENATAVEQLEFTCSSIARY